MSDCYICGMKITQSGESFGSEPVPGTKEMRSFHLSCKIPDIKPLEENNKGLKSQN